MTCRGMYGWVVGLICWSYLSEDNEAQDRMIAGTIRIPHQYWPMIVFVMFVFLIPGSSVLLNILCGVIGYLYVKQKLSLLMPSDARLTEIESKAILSPLTKAANFVPTADTSNPYLPIVNDQPSSSFAGQGHRLGP
ncbi:hypothetical protein EDC96DRAFT_440396 [Choanephora cucurbitarum]|nr:hypothetical protein EDC96DRAFT_440396 [Choanephora cucurbitarum]